MIEVKSILCSIVSNAIYDIIKYIKGSNDDKNIEDLIFLDVQKEFANEYSLTMDIGIIKKCISSPQYEDIINAYFKYKTIGIYSEKLSYITGNNGTVKIDIDDILKYLTTNLFETYNNNDSVVKHDKKLIMKVFKYIFECSEKYIYENIPIDIKNSMFFINSRIDFLYGSIDNTLKTLQDNIKHIIKSDVVKVEENFESIKKEYYNILKTKNSKAHIYLLDKFDFEKFYVPPILENDTSISNKNYIYKINQKWTQIFSQCNIVYITGGAGYGKSLFLKKIINDYSELELFHSEEYLVIYGELKMFYPNNADSPISVKEFLQNSMKTSTLMDETKISMEFIEYYLKLGRCIILFDALDEVEKHKREKIHESIISFFKNQNPNNKVCITSRNRGFIPEKDIKAFSIAPLDNDQIAEYVDKIIALGKFEKDDEETFMEQAQVLIDKGFLNSFLILSLLINIYKAERELPENKLELYQKCFEYISNKREKDKMQNSYDWKAIMPLMKDNTFMELANMCFPNNTAVDKDKIKDELINIYKTKYICVADTENAVDEFLNFCSDRTELFIPAAVEDKFQFFHRSFFEYFYSQYIFLRCVNENEMLEKLMQFDIDSEVFELTVAMLKQKNEYKYQALIELMIKRASKEFEVQDEEASYPVFNILIISMQVVDDALYQEEFLNILTKYNYKILKNIKKISNTNIIVNIFKTNERLREKIEEKYRKEILRSIIRELGRSINFTNDLIIQSKENNNFYINDLKKHISSGLKIENYLLNKFFYTSIFVSHIDIQELLDNIKDKEINNIYNNKKNGVNTQQIKANKYIREYRNLDASKKNIICDIIRSKFLV